MHSPDPSRPAGFTLIELLVVVTIIVVLLSLLTPALDRAIYQTELVVCAANQRAAATGAVNYTTDHRRRYPYRAGLYDDSMTQVEWLPNMLADTVTQGVKYDDRDMLKPYIALNKTLNDPLSGKIDIERAERGSAIMLPYYMYFGWIYAKGESGMVKFGDRFTWTADGKRETFNLLMADWALGDMTGAPGGWVYTSHADSLGQLINVVLQDQGAVAKGPVVGPVSNQWTLSRWQQTQLPAGGTLDANFAAQDLSVARFSGVKVNGVEVSTPGLAPAAGAKGGIWWPTYKVWLPR